jgi:hypothetical protein
MGGVILNKPVLIELNKRIYYKPFFWSIKRISNCLYSRRSGKYGKRFLGYSFVLRLFNKQII